MKGIILAAGTGSRVKPFSIIYSKHLMPIANKPIIYYSLSILMLAEIKEILIICNNDDLKSYIKLFGYGESIGIKIEYAIQNKPNGLVEAFIIGEKFIGSSDVALILGDNFFYGHGLKSKLLKAKKNITGARLFGYYVKNPKSYGIAEFDGDKISSIIEKPNVTDSNIAITGLYFYSNKVVEYSKQVTPSSRNELEISTLNQLFLKEDKCCIDILHRGFTWFDTGTYESLHEASNFVQIIENKQSFLIGCIEEIAFRNKWIDSSMIKESLYKYGKTPYGEYLKKLINF